ncbi:3'-5' exonuclease domain-containing protein 2 [Acidovorax sp. sic0104]|uniref:3'-5' exonuclease n=2 Tax=Acidovorax sp. sic0104 TaxID=2854784 RepID=UPI001C484525|nr:3'-5' exonuclease [Acidovorax sp. sic0104]MBV7543095.1 3'-5' exonuclease domain-containing protein 2 [Acidovorax sp. sic0104]
MPRMTASTPPRRAGARGQTQTPAPSPAATAPHGRSHHRAIPGKEQIALLDVFERLGTDRITLVRTTEQADRAREALCAATAWGFDTESKPTFVQGEASDGPHIVQLATLDHAWVFQLQDAGCRARVADLLALHGVTKAGFGLGDDTKRIKAKLGVEPADVLELNTMFRQRGYRKDMGVKAAVAVLFHRRFLKSKKAATSNWANERLTEAQVLYAANDAWAALRVFHALQGSEAPIADGEDKRSL